MMNAHSTAGTNRDLRDEIRDYWSDRAAHFDSDPGHKIGDGAERRAWQALFTRHLGPAQGRKVLDLASGTGEIAMLGAGLGFDVTGLDWSEAMLELARAKAAAQAGDVRFLQADAERTMEPDASYDVITTRHLVWTLVDPAAAFCEWLRVLRPGGTLLLVDGDFVKRSLVHRLLARALGIASAGASRDAIRHNSILSRVYFSQGARAREVADLLRAAGFVDVCIDTAMGDVHRAQRAGLGWRKALLRTQEHRYAICARKPVDQRPEAAHCA
ncbi:methyltransferase domain-containing protein [Pseudosulfitobacter sp. DSM 107133]|uniref:class I SAM-dependent methyltransferase n=1 Tax=Pseudosulfitobacter sp. DSM 107133 TaxID=2883100 RepID=UPI001962F53E|nr:methyltransferase domain-containing protein [Pseudosulfitobacter sp. DSM 107133]